MGYSLYIDTTHVLVVGVLDDLGRWVHWETIADTHSGTRLHGVIRDALKKQGIRFQDVKTFFQVAGPGSYTGIRLSEGLRQVVDWQGMASFSFYHHEVPLLLGIQKGIWFSTAHKGEMFCAEWGENGRHEWTLPTSQASARILEYDSRDRFSHFSDPYPELHPRATSSLIHDDAPIFFERVIREALHRPPFFFRPLELEFRQERDPLVRK